MNWRRPTWWFLHRVKGRFSQEAGAALFQGLRIRLTLWYCGVLGAALVLFSVVLYLGAEYFLINPIKDNAARHADAHVGQLVSSPTGNGYLGVVVIGETVQDQENALNLLLTLLLSVGGVALLGAGAGGLFLANRALSPARLAWTNQQRFIADAAHELRTPLTLLRADAEVLLRSGKHLEAEDAALLEDIVAEANHMSTIATNLLTLARLDTGTIHQEHEVVSL